MERETNDKLFIKQRRLFESYFGWMVGGLSKRIMTVDHGFILYATLIAPNEEYLESGQCYVSSSAC